MIPWIIALSLVRVQQNRLKRYYLFCCGSFLALNDGEFHLLSLAEGVEAITLNSAVMDEDITTAIALDEAVAFGIVKPLDRSGFSVGHDQDPFVNVCWRSSPNLLSG